MFLEMLVEKRLMFNSGLSWKLNSALNSLNYIKCAKNHQSWLVEKLRRSEMYSLVETLSSPQRWMLQMLIHVRAFPFWTINLHTFPLHNVDIIFRAGVIAVRAQGSPEVGPQLAMSSDKGTNYFSVGKRETESDGNSVRSDKRHSMTPRARKLHWGEQTLHQNTPHHWDCIKWVHVASQAPNQARSGSCESSGVLWTCSGS